METNTNTKLVQGMNQSKLNQTKPRRAEPITIHIHQEFNQHMVGHAVIEPLF